MKKSKLMKALLVFGMSMVTATAIVGFTACGDDHEHVDENSDGKCDICENDMQTDGEQGGGTLKVDVEEVELNESDITLDIGESFTLTATVTPDTATDKAVNWSVSPAGVVTVSHGTVTAEAAGTATVTATAGGKTATCTVKVNEPAPKPEVTEEEWKAALSIEAFANFTATMTQTGDNTDYLLDGDLENNKYHYNDNQGKDIYYSKEGDEYYKYEKGETDTEYTKSDSSQGDYEKQLFGLEHMAALSFKDSFDSFHYDEENEKYVGTGVSLGNQTYDVDAVFDNGKLVYVKVDLGQGANLTVTYVYGKTTVNLPKIDGEDDPTVETEVTEEQWAEILDGADNYVYTIQFLNSRSEIKVDGNKIEVTDTLYSTHQMLVKDGENYDAYTEKDGVWSKTTYTAESEDYEAYALTYTTYQSVLKVFKGDYNSFTYDDGKYTAATLDKTEAVGDTFENVVAKFENGGLLEVTYDRSQDKCTINGIGSVSIEVPTVGGNEDPDTITEWTSVGNPIHGEDAVYIYHHILLVGEAAKNYEFDSYEVTVKVDGKAGELAPGQNFTFTPDNISTHTYDMNIRIKANRYQSVEFTINFKKDGNTVAVGKYTREGNKEIVLNKAITTILVDATETISITSINGSDDLTGKKITWTVDKESVATIVDNEDGTVTVTGKAEGEVVLTCTVGEGKEAFSQICEITVSENNGPIDAVKVTDQFVHNNKFPHGDRKGVQIYCDLQDSAYAKLVKQIVPEKTVVTATKNGEAYTVQVLRKEWETNLYKFWIQISVDGDWADNDYEFSISFLDADDNEVAYGTYSEIAENAALYIKENLSLKLTEDGSTVTEILRATKTAAAEGTIAWKIEDTEGEGVATITPNEDGTYTVTAVAAGTATITVTVGDLTKTCVVTVLNPGAQSSDFVFENPYAYGDWWVQFTIKSAPAEFTSASFDYVKVYRDNDAGKQEAANYFADTNIFQVYCAKEAGKYASEYKFEFIKAGTVVAVYYWSNDGSKAPIA